MTPLRPLSLDDVPGVPPRGTLLCRGNELAEGQSKLFEFRAGAHRFEMFVHRVGARLVAFQNRCPHAGTPLDWQPGRLLDSGGDHFLCGTHGALFRRDDGHCLSGPCLGAHLRAVRIEVRDGDVYVPAVPLA